MIAGNKKIRMLVELEYDAELWHSDDESAREWFWRLLVGGGSEGLMLHSNEAGDIVGEIRVLAVLDEMK